MNRQSVLPYVIFLIIFSIILSVCEAQNYNVDNDGYFYDSRYDYLDVETLLGNKRLVRNYVDCLLNLKPCTPEGKALKRILPEGLRTKCARCTPRQKQNALVVLRRLRDNYPAEWARLAAKWDPTGDFTRSFEKILETDDNNNVGKPVKTTRAPPRPPPSPAVLSNNNPPPNMMNMDDQDQGNMGAPSEIKPTVEIFPTRRPIVTSTVQNTFKTTQYYPEPVTTRKTTMYYPDPPTRKPTKTRKPSTTTIKNKPKQSTPSTTTFYPDYKPVIFKPIYAGTMGLIDHFGNKIIKTTNIVTGLLKNTVRVVVG